MFLSTLRASRETYTDKASCRRFRSRNGDVYIAEETSGSSAHVNEVVIVSVTYPENEPIHGMFRFELDDKSSLPVYFPPSSDDVEFAIASLGIMPNTVTVDSFPAETEINRTGYIWRMNFSRLSAMWET